MIRWLDYNDTWLAAEWGHPSDNLGGILAVTDWLSRKRPGAAYDEGRSYGMIKAHEIKGCIALEIPSTRSVSTMWSSSKSPPQSTSGSHLRADHRSPFARLGRWPKPPHLSARAEHGVEKELGCRRCDQPGRPAGAHSQDRRGWLSLRADRANGEYEVSYNLPCSMCSQVTAQLAAVWSDPRYAKAHIHVAGMSLGGM